MFSVSNSTTESNEITTVPSSDVSDDPKYLVVPLVVIVFVIILSLLVSFIAEYLFSFIITTRQL